jgi:hypothetical protein
MTTPGSNLLKQALTVINPQFITYYKAASRTVNTIGQYVTTYASGLLVRGSFQAVPRRLYMAYGLDLQKSYYTFYTLNDMIDVVRDVSNDQLVYNGLRYQVESNNDWFAQDGWKGVLCCYITPGS